MGTKSWELSLSGVRKTGFELSGWRQLLFFPTCKRFPELQFSSPVECRVIPIKCLCRNEARVDAVGCMEDFCCPPPH